MKAKCPNCGRGLSCGCQRRKASDGTTVCTSCLNLYEQKLKQKKGHASYAAAPNPEDILPTNVTVLYNPGTRI